ncbi:MAG: response regulator [Proteobacteria bacterium]|nr:response regulator [Pseudomonadota bacterium]
MSSLKGKILIVDDDANLRESLKDNLELDGYEIAEAGTGQEAMRLVVTGFYDVILMDFNLTDTTGIEVIRQIRKVNTESQILMMTAHASLDTALKAIQESVEDFLIKPVDFNYLKRAISKSLEKLRLRQENQRLINDLRRANEQLLNLSNMKSKFMSMASHDLSNSLMTLQLSFEMLTGNFNPNEEQKKRITYISSGIGQISRLIEDLVDWAAIEQGKLRMEKVSFPVVKMIEEAVAGPQGKAAQRNIGMRVEIDPRLQSIVADRRRVAQVVANLLENAIRHTPSGGNIIVQATFSRDGHAQLAVRDTGEGIAAAELTRIFESFYQPITAKQSAQHGRLGLGLSIAREIVAGHGGRIWVESEGLGKGATFYFTIPPNAETPAAERQAAAAAK